MLMANTEWAINVHYITGIGNMVYGFDRDGDLFSHDTTLHVTRDYNHRFSAITGNSMPPYLCCLSHLKLI
jgi:hypothetical protein